MEVNLQDVSITINGLVSHCKCKCKHCLLCSGDNKLEAISYDKLEELALKFDGFRTATGINASLCVYNCADYPELPRAMDVDRKISAYSGYQNLNGTPIRSGIKLSEWVSYLKNECKVTNANLSWFGNEEFHDSFVQCMGYYQYLIELALELSKQNVDYHNTVFILHSNLEMLEELYHTLDQLGGAISFSLLDYRGDAKSIKEEFLSQEDSKKLPEFMFQKNLISKEAYGYVLDKMNCIHAQLIPIYTSICSNTVSRLIIFVRSPLFMRFPAIFVFIHPNNRLPIH